MNVPTSALNAAYDNGFAVGLNRKPVCRSTNPFDFDTEKDQRAEWFKGFDDGAVRGTHRDWEKA